MSQGFPKEKFPQIKFIIGDVRDKERMFEVFEGVDYVIHTAAMKDIHTAEDNPQECIKTNINGAQNIIAACLKHNIKRVISLSTDKACSPNSLYGATKLVSDKLFIAANQKSSSKNTIFSVVRYGNLFASSGSVVPFFIKKKEEDGILPITDPKMTRFNITIPKAVNFVIDSLEKAWGSEIFVPRLASYKILDLANAICDSCDKPIIGIRPGEKLHEEMISESDSYYTYEIGDYYVVLPQSTNWNLEGFIKHFKANKVPQGFSYNSGENDIWESVDILRDFIVKQQL